MGARSGGGGGAAGGGGGRRVGARTQVDRVLGKTLTANGNGGRQVSLTVNKPNNLYSITVGPNGGQKTYANLTHKEAQDFFSGFMKLNTWKKG